MKFNLAHGPWTPIFKGEMEGFESEIYTNSESMILSIIYEKNKKGEKVGAVVELFKAFYAKGKITSFVETLPKRAVALIIHPGEKTYKFLLIDSGAVYAPYKEKIFAVHIDALITKIVSFSTLLQEVSTAYDIDLVEIQNCSDEEKSAFFSLPLANILLMPVIKKRSENTVMEVGQGEIHLGITKSGNIVKEPFDFFDRTIVSGGKKEDRIHVLHIFAESAMLSGMPVIIIDWEDSFKGLNYPNENYEELKKYKVSLEPVGFPIKVLTAGKDFGAQIDLIDAQTFVELFGVGKTVAAQVIVDAFKLGSCKNAKELIEKIAQIPETAKVTPFKKREAQRIIEVIDTAYPNLLSGKIPVEEMVKPWARGLGKANILLFSKEDPEKNFLILQTTIRALYYHLKQQGKSDKLKAVLLFTNANETIPKFKMKRVNEIIALDLSLLRNYGLGIIVEAEDRTNIHSEVKNLIISHIGVIAGNDVGVVIEKRKNYRALVRPGLSNCCKKAS